MKYLESVIFALAAVLALAILGLLYAPMANAGLEDGCANHVGDFSVVVLDSTIVANSGLLPGDEIWAIWEGPNEDTGETELWCAGESAPYVPGLSFVIDPASGERINGGIGLSVSMDDPFAMDLRDWTFPHPLYLLVNRSGIYFLTAAAADAAPAGFPDLGPQPWAHTGGEQFFWLSEFIVLIVVAVEGEDEGYALISAPFPNPSGGVVWLPHAGAFRIYDLVGRFMLEGVGSWADLLYLPRGVYVLWSGETSHLITHL